MPVISVVIPVYNGEKTIGETVQSILHQTFSDFELIIINSGSTDRTLDVLTTFNDARIKIFTYDKAIVAVNRNRGFQNSSGALITFIDADDLWTTDKLEAQSKALTAAPDAAVVYSWTNCVDEQGNFLRQCSYVNWTGNVLPKLLLDDFIGSGSNIMIRRDAFEAVGGFDESLSNAEDTDLALRLAVRYEFTVVPAPHVLYRISSVSKSANTLKMEEANLRVIDRAFKAAPASLHYLKPYAIGNLYKYLLYKALNAPPGQQKMLITARLIVQGIITDPALLKTPVIYKAMLKFMIITLLPPQQAETLLLKFPRLANTSTFLGYEKVNIP